MQRNAECPVCGHTEEHLLLEETDGWFICSKCGSELKIEYTEGVRYIQIKKKGKVLKAPYVCPNCHASQTLTDEETEKGICKCYNCGKESPVIIAGGVALPLQDSLKD